MGVLRGIPGRGRLADEIVFLHNGRVAEAATAEACFEKPVSETAQAFLEGRLMW